MNSAKLALLTLLPLAAVAETDAPEFEKLQASYKSAVERTTKPLVQNYLAELEKLRAAFARAANLDAAVEVQKEMDAVYQGIAFAGTSAGTAPQVAGTPQAAAMAIGQESRVTIPANDVNGYKIGPLKKGMTITLAYAGGLWKGDGRVASDSPDAARPERGEKSRLVIANGRYKTQAGPVLAVVPVGTATTPFSYKLEDDVENVVLRINEDGNNYADNPGAVTYKLTISR